MRIFSMSASPDVIHASRFRPSGARWFFARARLLPDRLEFIGWTWKGRRKEIVPLVDVARVRWTSCIHKTENFVLERHGDTPVRAWIKGPGLWKYTIEAHAPNTTTAGKRKSRVASHAA